MVVKKLGNHYLFELNEKLVAGCDWPLATLTGKPIIQALNCLFHILRAAGIG